MRNYCCNTSGHVAVRARLQAGLALLGFLAAGLAGAQQASWADHPGLQDRWTLQFGVYAPNVNTTAYLNSSTLGRGTSVSFEDDLNLTDRKAMPTFLGSVRLGERWKIEFEYFSLHRSGSRAINRTINWGDSVYPIGAVVNSEFNSDIYRLSGGYSFVKDKQRELGVALGLHVTDFSTSLSAPGVGVTIGETLAPLPTVGVYGAYAFNPKWLLTGRLDYFGLKYDEYDGSLINFNVGVEYRFTRKFGVGLGFRHVDYDVTATDAKYNGGIEYKFNGPVLYGVASF